MNDPVSAKLKEIADVLNKIGTSEVQIWMSPRDKALMKEMKRMADDCYKTLETQNGMFN